MANDILNEVTAVISIRVPYKLKQYITEKAIGMSINPTTYACHILSKAIEQPEADNLEIEQLRAALLEQTEFTQKESERLQGEVSTLQKQLEAANEAEKRYKGEIATDSKTVAELKTLATNLKNKYAECLKINEDWVKIFEAEKKQKEAAINDRKEVAKIADGIWDLYHKEHGKVPEKFDKPLRKISRY